MPRDFLSGRMSSTRTSTYLLPGCSMEIQHGPQLQHFSQEKHTHWSQALADNIQLPIKIYSEEEKRGNTKVAETTMTLTVLNRHGTQHTSHLKLAATRTPSTRRQRTKYHTTSQSTIKSFKREGRATSTRQSSLQIKEHT